jgi:transposase
MCCIPLPPADRAALRAAVRTAPDHPTRQRALILLLLRAGVTWAAIAVALGCSTATIARWADRYRVGGVSAWAARPARPRILARWAAAIVTWVLTRSPRDFGFARSRWSCEAVAVLLADDHVNGLHTVEFLTHLLRVAGGRLLVIWDGSPIHRRAEVKDFVASSRGRIRVEALPGYAPDLNPWDEGRWHRLKNVELRNQPTRDLEELHEEFHLAVGRLRRRPRLIRSFFAQAGLKL